MNQLRIFILCSFILGFATTNSIQANAIVLKLNNTNIKGHADDGFNLTFIPETGLVWLDATISNGHTTPEIKARMANPKDDLYGFRYATSEEVEALMKSYGLPSNGEVAGADAAQAFMEDFGDLGSGHHTMYGPSIGPVWPVRDDLNQYKQIIARNKEGKSSVGQGGIDPNSKECHFLVFDGKLIPHHVATVRTSGDKNNMTFDTRTGYDWLDISNTINHSIHGIEKRIQNPSDER